MKRMRHHVARHHTSPLWLPIDSRLIPDIFTFGHVKGLARLFLEIEIILATLVVVGTLLVAAVKMMTV